MDSNQHNQGYPHPQPYAQAYGQSGTNAPPYGIQPNIYSHPQPPPPYDTTQSQQYSAFNQHNMYGGTQPTEAVIVEQPVHFIVAPHVGPDPSMITCPSCKATVVTRVDYETSAKTHIFAGLLCLFGCWCCVCFPYCMDSCKNGNHYCPNCGTYIGSYNG